MKQSNKHITQVLVHSISRYISIILNKTLSKAGEKHVKYVNHVSRFFLVWIFKYTSQNDQEPETVSRNCPVKRAVKSVTLHK